MKVKFERALVIAQTILIVVGVLASYYNAAHVSAQSAAQPTDICIGADGKPVFLETMGDHLSIYVTYLNRNGDLIAKHIVTSAWDKTVYTDGEGVIAKGECRAGSQ